MNETDPDMIIWRMRYHGMGCGQENDHFMCGRHFFTKEEKSELLKKYKEWLEKESEGVREMMDEINKN